MAVLPTGLILLWSGSIASIPGGWVLCDGTNGTPDLRDRFVIAAGGSYAVGANGGNSSHTHTFTSDGHFHTLNAGYNLASGVVWSNQTNSETDSGTTDPADHLPPYYALAFIMKS